MSDDVRNGLRRASKKLSICCEHHFGMELPEPGGRSRHGLDTWGCHGLVATGVVAPWQPPCVNCGCAKLVNLSAPAHSQGAVRVQSGCSHMPCTCLALTSVDETVGSHPQTLMQQPATHQFTRIANAHRKLAHHASCTPGHSWGACRSPSSFRAVRCTCTFHMSTIFFLFVVNLDTVWTPFKPTKLLTFQACLD